MTDALILKLYYLDDLTMYEIGQAFGQSESNISQRHQLYSPMSAEDSERRHDPHAVLSAAALHG